MQFFSIALFCAIEKYELKLYDVGSDKDEKNGINKMEYIVCKLKIAYQKISIY